jgi:hypothetical protein
MLFVVRHLRAIQSLLVVGVAALSATLALNIRLVRGCFPGEPCFGPQGYFYRIFDFELSRQVPHFALGLIISVAASVLLRFLKVIDTATMVPLAAFLFLFTSLLLILWFPFLVVY